MIVYDNVSAAGDSAIVQAHGGAFVVAWKGAAVGDGIQIQTSFLDASGVEHWVNAHPDRGTNVYADTEGQVRLFAMGSSRIKLSIAGGTVTNLNAWVSQT